jgi:DNA relaxase NicK
MSKKKFDKFFVANLKRTAQMVSPMVKEKQKLQSVISEAMERISVLDSQIAKLDSNIRETSGFGVEELIERVVYTTHKLDKDNNPVEVKTVKWELKYPETIIPVEEEVVEEALVENEATATVNFEIENENDCIIKNIEE